MAKARRWEIRLTAAAERDFQHILRWTREHFGKKQVGVYAETLIRTIDALEEGPSMSGAKKHDKIAKGLMTLHVARKGRKGRHLVLYRTDPGASIPTIEVLRLLHDSMDLPRYMSPDENGD